MTDDSAKDLTTDEMLRTIQERLARLERQAEEPSNPQILPFAVYSTQELVKITGKSYSAVSRAARRGSLKQSRYGALYLGLHVLHWLGMAKDMPITVNVIINPEMTSVIRVEPELFSESR